MTDAPACLVCGIDTGQKSVNSKQDEHAIHSAGILNMISGAGGVSISNDISSIQVIWRETFCWSANNACAGHVLYAACRTAGAAGHDAAS